MVVAREPRLIALPDDHPLAARAYADLEVTDFTDFLDEPFLALSPDAGPMRDHWRALYARGGREPVIGGVIAGAEQTHEALANGQGVALLASGNAPLIARDHVICLPVRAITPSELAVTARHDDERPPGPRLSGRRGGAGRRGKSPGTALRTAHRHVGAEPDGPIPSSLVGWSLTTGSGAEHGATA